MARRRKSVSRAMVRNRKRRTKSEKSSLELKVEAWLKEAGIAYQSQFPISLCHTDLYFPATKTAVELNGCYWHACPECLPGKQEHSRQRAKDMKRYSVFWRLGHKVLVLWEHEIEKDFETVKKKLLHAAGIMPYAPAV